MCFVQPKHVPVSRCVLALPSKHDLLLNRLPLPIVNTRRQTSGHANAQAHTHTPLFFQLLFSSSFPLIGGLVIRDGFPRAPKEGQWFEPKSNPIQPRRCQPLPPPAALRASVEARRAEAQPREEVNWAKPQPLGFAGKGLASPFEPPAPNKATKQPPKVAHKMRLAEILRGRAHAQRGTQGATKQILA